MIIKWGKHLLNKFSRKNKKSSVIQEFEKKYNLSPDEIKKIMLSLEPNMISENKSQHNSECDKKLSSEELQNKRIKDLMKYLDTLGVDKNLYEDAK